MALNPNNEPRKARQSVTQRIFSGWKRDGGQAKYPPGQSPYDKGGTKPRLRAWHGWKDILFDSWFNVMILLIPVAGILKATTENSETLIFVACLLAMIPLVKLHDLATGVLSRRIGGSKTGLLNSSLSNVVELVVAIIALRKCELRIVQSSLIGAMLSKLLLILGMCFFAGGTRFSEQGFDSTATQIHSSLLSISVGAVLLPAAFHFSLTYTSDDDADDAGTSLQEQKGDILRMSRGVAVVLLFIYASYLVFQLWSHTHLYQDITEPSNKLQVPVAASVRSATARVRQKSNNLARSMSNARSIDKIRYKATGSRPVTPALSDRVFSPVEEAPETSFDDVDMRGKGPYMFPSRSPALGDSRANVNSRTALLLSPMSSASQVTLSNPIAQPADTTVRLVTDQERFIIAREGSGSESGESGSGRSSPTSASSGSGEESFDSEKERERDREREREKEKEKEAMEWQRRADRGRSRTPMSEVLSAYYQESLKGDGGESTRVNTVDEMGRRWQERNGSLGQYGPSDSEEPVGEKEPELSWTMTLLLLSCVTVLVAVNAEWMVDTMDNLSPSISKEWIGLILLPTVSAIAECVTAVNVSVKDQLSLSISVAVGSTIQTALFVIPIMVVLGWILDKPLALLFDPFESVVLYISVHTMGYVVADGKSNWLEGVILICLYVVIAVTFWFYPGSNFSSNLAVCTMSPPVTL